MWIFLLILGIILTIGGIISLVISMEDSYDGDLLIIFGMIGLFVGVILTITSIVGVCGGFHKKQTIATEVKTDVVSDSVQVKIPSDTIKYIMYIISYKDEDGVWAGKNIKLFGYTQKNIGDTITIQIK